MRTLMNQSNYEINIHYHAYNQASSNQGLQTKSLLTTP